MARQSDVVITKLPNSPHVREVVPGENGVLSGAGSGMLLIDMSSTAPLVSKELSVECEKKGVTMFDAPVSDGEPKAVDGSLSIMVGGPEERSGEIEPKARKMPPCSFQSGDGIFARILYGQGEGESSQNWDLQSFHML